MTAARQHRSASDKVGGIKQYSGGRRRTDDSMKERVHANVRRPVLSKLKRIEVMMKNGYDVAGCLDCRGFGSWYLGMLEVCGIGGLGYQTFRSLDVRSVEMLRVLRCCECLDVTSVEMLRVLRCYEC
jgi:hypothetical protein